MRAIDATQGFPTLGEGGQGRGTVQHHRRRLQNVIQMLPETSATRPASGERVRGLEPRRDGASRRTRREAAGSRRVDRGEASKRQSSEQRLQNTRQAGGDRQGISGRASARGRYRALSRDRRSLRTSGSLTNAEANRDATAAFYQALFETLAGPESERQEASQHGIQAMSHRQKQTEWERRRYRTTQLQDHAATESIPSRATRLSPARRFQTEPNLVGPAYSLRRPAHVSRVPAQGKRGKGPQTK